MSETAMRQVTAEQVLARLKGLPPFPPVRHAVDKALQSDTPDRIARLIARDPGLTATTLKLANSPFHGLSGRVASLRDAVQILGVPTLSSALATPSIACRLDAAACSAFDMADSWRHALGTAVCARFLAESRGIDPCAAYTAGLLHDIGKLALATTFPETFNEILVWAGRHDVSTVDAEREFLGTDHAVIGGMLARHWRLPPGVADAVRLHHEVPEGPAVTLADVVHIADSIVHALGVSQAAADLVPPLAIAAWSRVAPTAAELEWAFVHVETRLRRLARLGYFGAREMMR